MFYLFRLSTLLKEIMAEKENKTIVFIETKRRVDEITRKMKRDGWPAVCIHGDKTQQERDWVLQGNKKFKYNDFFTLIVNKYSKTKFLFQISDLEKLPY